MKHIKLTTILWVVSLFSASLHAQGEAVPRLRFAGDEFADKASAIFAETLQDMRNKIEDGSNPKFPKGFFHTSTEEAGVPQYYNDMWSRDCGRGVIELSRLGFAGDALNISRYFLSHITLGNHWSRELHQPNSSKVCELDGNALILSAICATWRANAQDKAIGKEFCDGITPVVQWVDSLVKVSPYGGLLPSSSELSGNPSADYPVYSVFGNYGMYGVMAQIADMAEALGNQSLNDLSLRIRSSLESALNRLISDGQFSYAPQGCWFNGIDGRNGRAYDISDWDGTAWPVWHWTRQLPYILNYDYASAFADGTFADTHRKSYQLLRQWMAKGGMF